MYRKKSLEVEEEKELTLSVLKDARELLSEPTRWTCGAFARDQCGNWVDVVEPRASCWCLIGAISRTITLKSWEDDRFRHLEKDQIFDRLERLNTFKDSGAKNIPDFNDGGGTEHEHVLMLLDEAVGDIEKEAKK